MSEPETFGTDLAARALGGAVVWASDESFAERENLLRPGPAVHDPTAFGHKGKVYDGWETRRRRAPGRDEADQAIVRLGAPGVVRTLVVDTAWFTGNYPPHASVEAACVPGHPDVEQLRRADWETLVSRSALAGDTKNTFVVTSDRRWTHVRLSIYPDGGVARFRVYGDPVPDPRLLDVLGTADLAAAENGGRVVGCSNMFYGAPGNLLLPGPVRSMGEGWETARRRDEQNDWVSVRLAGEGVLRVAELDTSYFAFNAPESATLSGCCAPDGPTEETPWFCLLPRTKLQPDTPHRFRLPPASAVTHVRMDVFPDGGMARLRLIGELSAAGRSAIGLRWFNAVSAASAARVLVEDAGLDQPDAVRLADARPYPAESDLPPAVRALVSGHGR